MAANAVPDGAANATEHFECKQSTEKRLLDLEHDAGAASPNEAPRAIRALEEPRDASKEPSVAASAPTYRRESTFPAKNRPGEHEF